MAEKQYVYLLWKENFEQDKLIEVYATREKAEKRKKGYTYWDQASMFIEKRTIE